MPSEGSASERGSAAAGCSRSRSPQCHNPPVHPPPHPGAWIEGDPHDPARLARCPRAAPPLAGSLPAQEVPPFDLVLEHGHVVDGTGSPWYSGDVGIRDGRIAAIGNLAGAPAKRRIDVAGKVVAPGFIDMLGQSELTILVEPRLPSKIFQGITTEIDRRGRLDRRRSPMPWWPTDRRGYDHMGITADWRTFGQYFARLEKQGMGINLATYVGATQVRRLVVGEENRPATPAELERMKALVREAMEQGAVGVSTSLQYAPAPYASTEELIALAAESARYGGIYATHMRSESDAVLAAIDEAIRIAREAQDPGRDLAPESRRQAQLGADAGHRQEDRRGARRGGVDITADTYAYPAWFNSFSAFVPPWAHEGGDDRMIARLKDPTTRARIRKEMESATTDRLGQRVAGGPRPRGDPALGLPEPGARAAPGQDPGRDRQAPRQRADRDPLRPPDRGPRLHRGRGLRHVRAGRRRWPSSSPGCRSATTPRAPLPTGPLGKEHPHPRAYGTFPRILRKYVREDGQLTLPEAIRKFSALPAQRLRLTDRGVLKQGMWADVVVFDPATIHDVATFENPNQLSVGDGDTCWSTACR